MRKSTTTGPIPRTIDEYLASVPEPARGTLQQIRLIIRSAVPAGALEVITYSMPGFHYKGTLLSFAAFTNHCSLFPMSYAVIEKFQTELQAFPTSKGTIQFPMDQPLSAALIRKIVKARIAENEARNRPPVKTRYYSHPPAKPATPARKTARVATGTPPASKPSAGRKSAAKPASAAPPKRKRPNR